MKAGDGTEGTSDAAESEDQDGEATAHLSANPEQTHESCRKTVFCMEVVKDC